MELNVNICHAMEIGNSEKEAKLEVQNWTMTLRKCKTKDKIRNGDRTT